ncbi:hypothetical protein OG735_37080 [Streptomyces sp. NBC_01210]|uniref:hypothetical protein n=1 Tax=Streptomyces sp. NBC_01210 TaxID=2903774 RepID=UPI002E1576A6|nr:hypothetical protein OG735_37080 [Streptomyces sp. NBC_01210]
MGEDGTEYEEPNGGAGSVNRAYDDQTHDDVLATTDLLAVDGVVSKGRQHVRDRIGGASLGRPLGYALPGADLQGAADGGVAAAATHRDILLCFPFDLEELPEGRGYQQVSLAVRLDDGTHALTLHPAPGTTAADGTEVAAFGLGRDRLRWTFRAPGRSGALRPDGRWAQAVVRLPGTAAEVSGRLSLTTVTVQPVLGGTFLRREAETPYDTPFRLQVAEVWPAATPLAHPGALPGAWALCAYEEGASEEGASTDGEEAGPDSRELPPGLRRLCLAVDIEKYSARDNADMVRLQRVLLRTLRSACEQAGIEWRHCGRQAQGDGYLLVLEPGIDETRVVPRLLDGLAAGLAVANAPATASDRTKPGGRAADSRVPGSIRMRASLHQGIVHEADSGYAGSAVVALFRVLDSGPVRRALAETLSTHLVVAFSDALYQDLVATGYEGLSATGFRRVEIHVEAKSFTGVAWIRAMHPGVTRGC